MFDTAQPSYQALRKLVSERTQHVVAWVGAGLSTAAKLPTWGELRKKVTDAARSQASARPDKVLSERDLTAIAAISKIESHWTAFQRLRDVIGEPTFVSVIRKELSTADDAEIPKAYRDLWSLSPRGIITLNIDRYAARGFAEAHPGKALTEINSGSTSGQYGSVLQSTTPLVLNAHGVLGNKESWVFSQQDIDQLLANEAYKTFVTSLIATSVVVFIGITVDDVASGGFLERMLNSGFSTGEHYWLTNRGDDAAKTYANKAGIQPIYYSASEGHEAPLSAFFDDLTKFKSRDDIAPPVRHVGKLTASAIVDPAAPPNEIRLGLAQLVEEALETSSPSESIKAIKAMRERHERAIHAAWFVSTSEPDNRFFTYKIEEKLGEGGFGKVYLGRGEDGGLVAVKVLRQEILENDDLVGSFRRGVRSMQILSERHVEGMVAFVNAFELPPTVVMEYVDGPNVQQLKERGELSDLIDILGVALNVAEIVHRGHALPERVLHRDIRPANIMIRDFDTTGSMNDVVVLDFDLSWHRGSNERSVDLSSVATIGYLAPELIAREPGRSTRSTTVDVFGLAMAMYYMMAGVHPRIGIIHSDEWSSVVKGAVAPLVRGTAWKSLGRRVQRLIQSCTNPDQGLRPDMPTMMTELKRITSALVSPDTVMSAELLAEEMAAQSSVGREYDWNENTLSCSFRLTSGVEVQLVPDEFCGEVRLRLGYADRGQVDRRGVKKYVDQKRVAVAAQLKAAGWQNVVAQSDSSSLGVEAVISVDLLAKRMAALAAAVSESMHKFSME